MLKTLAVIAVIIATARCGSAADDTFVRELAGVKNALDLPKQVVAEAGKLTLFADFANIKDSGKEALTEDYDEKQAAALKDWNIRNRVPIYLVNRTGKGIELSSQDGHCYTQLEYEETPGKWVRAQSHRFSWCGNSYNSVVLKDGEFILCHGYLPEKGRAAQVRYGLYNQKAKAVSNAGAGLVDAAQIKNAAHDVLTVIDADYDYVCKVARGDTEPKEEVPDYPATRRDAMRLLASKFADRPESVKLLLEIRNKEGKFGEDAQDALNDYYREKEEKELKEQKKDPAK